LGRDTQLRADKQGAQRMGDGSIVFRLLFTMRVVADQACNYSPELSAKMTGGRAQQRKRM
jgi:hypothetical protein